LLGVQRVAAVQDGLEAPEHLTLALGMGDDMLVAGARFGLGFDSQVAFDPGQGIKRYGSGHGVYLSGAWAPGFSLPPSFPSRTLFF
jgi:hypothetical protein